MRLSSLIFIVSWLLSIIICVSATCNQCGSNSGVVCTSYNTFMFCSNGIPFGVNNTCPSFTACSNTPEICTSPSVAYDCAPTCGTCSLDGRFACVNSTTYALCFGGTTPSSVMGTCDSGTFCDITVTAPPFCSNNAASACDTSTNIPTTTTSTTTASTSTSSTTSTTAATTTTTIATVTESTTTASTSSTASTTTIAAATYCSQINARDKTRYAAPYMSNCSAYVFCFINAGNRTGSYYNCPGSTIFNDQTGYCVDSASYTCPSGQ